MLKEDQIEMEFIEQLVGLKYVYRADITDIKSLEDNFRTKFEELNKVKLSNSEFLRLRGEIITSDVFETSKILRENRKGLMQKLFSKMSEL